MAASIKKIFLILLFISPNIFSQPLSKEEMLKFYPYNIGNWWRYWWIFYDPINNYAEGGVDKYSIVGDTVINLKPVYVITLQSKGPIKKFYERIDSTTGNVFRQNQWTNYYSEKCIDNIYANIGDTIKIEDELLGQSDKLLVKAIYDSTVSNLSTKIREVIYLASGNVSKFALGLGRLSFGERYELDSAMINGNAYDITTNIEEPSDIPTEFILYQNYPNPFNPETTISYKLHVSGYTTLKVYDVLGREVATLVNDYQIPGKYSVRFNLETRSGESLPSGICFYRLTVGKFSTTRKMILLK